MFFSFRSTPIRSAGSRVCNFLSLCLSFEQKCLREGQSPGRQRPAGPHRIGCDPGRAKLTLRELSSPQRCDTSFGFGGERERERKIHNKHPYFLLPGYHAPLAFKVENCERRFHRRLVAPDQARRFVPLNGKANSCGSKTGALC